MWEFINVSGSSGGIHHVHGLQFQIVERSVDDVEESGWETVKEGFVDEGWQDTVLLTPAMRAKVLLRFADYVGLFVYHCHNLPHGDAGMMRNYRVESTETAVLERYFDRRPETFILEQNYPNPFNSSTTISFTLPARGETELVVYNLLKQKVATIVQGVRPAGAYAVHWDGRDDQGRPLASGTYFYSLQMADQLRTRKLSLLR
jgi:hypothetical protein